MRVRVVAMAVLTALGVLGVVGVANAGGAAPRTNEQGADFKPPATRAAWLARRAAVRQRILISCGLYPMWPRTPLNPKTYGKVQRDGYTVEKVVLETLPGFYLSGNLYRPSKMEGKIPGILNPHGHWAEGRIQPDVQARCIGQARMGATAFLYDMVGYADSRPFGHSFTDDELVTRGLNLNGLQLWNSMRALDWLLTLPEVDAERIACTGESGGGTQTFELCAVDDRVAVAAPVCMVSHHFQGGCQCENAPLKRVGTDNVEFAACFAPKPMLLVGATGDWTSEIMQHGVPEIRGVYRLFGADEKLEAVVHDAPHNYNKASRESVYTFLRKQLFWKGARTSVTEGDFKAEPGPTFYTWDAEHPRPAGAATPESVKAYLTEVVATQVKAWEPETGGQWRRDARMLTDVLRVLVAAPATGQVATFEPEKGVRGAVVVAHPGGSGALAPDGKPGPLVQDLLKKGQLVLIPEPAQGTDAAAIARRQGATYYSTYNPTVLAERVQAIVLAVNHARKRTKDVRLLGLGAAGPWALLARPLAEPLEAVAADAAQFEWGATPITSEMALPGALRYGGMRTFAALGETERLLIHNYAPALDVSWVKDAYRVRTFENHLRLSREALSPEAAVRWLF